VAAKVSVLIPDASPTPLPQPQSCSLMLPHGWRN
jgi:hypothetical protein